MVTTSATKSSPAGDYDIVVSGAEAKNYEISYVNGTLTVTAAPTNRGDVNGDGKVNGTDIQAVINVIVEEDYVKDADVNNDGKVNGTDIQEIINIIVEEE